MPKPDELELIRKYQDGTASEEEKALLETWYLHYNQQEDNQLSESEYQAISADIWKNLDHASRPAVIRRLNWSKLAIAAAILLFITIGTYFYVNKPYNRTPQQMAQNIMPGGDAAYLTLSDGKVIVLNKRNIGDLANEAGVTIKKTTPGELIYEADLQAEGVTAEKNTITTPNGGQYTVILSDGTKIWLNAGSSLTFPSRFTGDFREVDLKGEGYFEVAKDSSHPFHVLAGGQEISVLGTHFNVSAYSDEPSIRTTLVEGSVKVTHHGQSFMLSPNDRVTDQRKDGHLRLEHGIDADEDIAWKSGRFYFNNTAVSTVLRQVGRWYNLDIVYEGKVPGDFLSGSMSRNQDLSQVAKLLALTGIKFRIEGRKLIVQ
ncbi:FecR family protein [Mucilaginibacter terrae]|uniref:Transmembrane sensor n=1 Tax=Mucilaginibacter terrae TaxID=1955052 RepID=A0ABU3GRE1_9SPHI|nr:FecR domain-containing protein [Mucilaginibacter terrae]MDT3402348.1 transmembrane sensor [Mucilaginibacter terrae]